MKSILNFVLLLSVATIFSQCDKVNYRKTKSGLVYKIYPGKGKDSIIKYGQIVKFSVTTKYNDSLMYNSNGKMPGFLRVQQSEKPPYNLSAVFPLMRKGDSAIVVQMVDTLMKNAAQLPPNAKKGDRITTMIRIIDVFSSDSIAKIDYDAEMKKDFPLQVKEQADMRREIMRKQDVELEKTGELSRELKEIEAFLAQKKIDAKKTGRGTYYAIQQQGTGAKAENGKFVNVKYTGRILLTDSTFEAGSYEFNLGQAEVIAGWDEGIEQLNVGSKAVLYIPGFLAYGPNPRNGFKPNTALKFDVELLNVSDTPTVKPVRR